MSDFSLIAESVEVAVATSSRVIWKEFEAMEPEEVEEMGC